MTTATAEPKQDTYQVGKFTMRVVVSENTSERWHRRHEALANWLLAEWEREQRQRIAERN